MISRWAYILIGKNNTGKTNFQKWLIWFLCNSPKPGKLQLNLVHAVNHRDAPRKLKTLFTMNRSFQESYKDIDDYFQHHFKETDVSILSSHSDPSSMNDIRAMITELQKKYYNVCAVFFTNSMNSDTENIATLNWKEIIRIDNPHTADKEEWEKQIENGAKYFTDMVIKKASLY